MTTEHTAIEETVVIAYEHAHELRRACRGRLEQALDVVHCLGWLGREESYQLALECWESGDGTLSGYRQDEFELYWLSQALAYLDTESIMVLGQLEIAGLARRMTIGEYRAMRR